MDGLSAKWERAAFAAHLCLGVRLWNARAEAARSHLGAPLTTTLQRSDWAGGSRRHDKSKGLGRVFGVRYACNIAYTEVRIRQKA